MFLLQFLQLTFFQHSRLLSFLCFHFYDCFNRFVFTWVAIFEFLTIVHKFKVLRLFIVLIYCDSYLCPSWTYCFFIYLTSIYLLEVVINFGYHQNFCGFILKFYHIYPWLSFCFSFMWFMVQIYIRSGICSLIRHEAAEHCIYGYWISLVTDYVMLGWRPCIGPS